MSWILVLFLCTGGPSGDCKLMLRPYDTKAECKHMAAIAKTDPKMKLSRCQTEDELFEE